MPVFSDYSSIAGYLDKLGMFHMDFSLQSLPKALDFFGLRRPSCPVVQIVGTNGKGSTSTFLANLATAHGLRTGLFVSPHFVSPRERILVDGRMLSEAAWVRLAHRLTHGLNVLFPAKEDPLTYFEWVTLLSLLAFAEAHTDLIILEAGLGGTLDATTQVSADLVCFTPIALDHQHILGSTLVEIATDKAGAIRERGGAITIAQDSAVLEVLQQAAQQKGVNLDIASAPHNMPPLGLQGPHQKENATLAIAAWRYLASRYSWPSSMEEEQAGLKKSFIAGRLQRIPATEEHPAYVLDGAHNEHSLSSLDAALDALFIQPAAIVFTCLADKNTQGLLQAMHKLAKDIPVIVPPLDNPRAQSPEAVVEQLKQAGIQASPAESFDAALAQASALALHGPVLVTGSLYLLGAFFTRYPLYLTVRAASH